MGKTKQNSKILNFILHIRVFGVAHYECEIRIQKFKMLDVYGTI